MTDHPSSFDRRLIAPLVLGSILNPVNSSILAVSLIPIGRDFGATPAHTAWLISGLYLATAIGQPVVGRLVDAFGPRRLYLGGTALVGAAGLLGMLAPSLAVLVVARVLLGFGTCSGYPAAMYLIRTESERTGQQSPAGVLTLLTIANQTIAVLGPPLGGLLVGVGGWRSTLAVNIPLSLACLWLGNRRLPDVRVDEAPPVRLDLAGIALFSAAVVPALLFLMDVRPDRWWLLAITLPASMAFVLVELRAPDPFVDLRLLAGSVPLVATYVRSLLTAIVSYGVLYGYTQWLEDGRGLSASHAGLLLLPLFATAIIVSALTGRSPLIRAKLVVGSVAQVVGAALLLLAGDTTSLWLLAGLMLILGVPQGLNNLANQNALYFQAEPARMGSSAGLLRTFFYLGALVTSAAQGAFLHERADTAGLHELAAFLLVVAVLALLLAVLDRSLRASRGAPEAAEAGLPA